MTLTASNVRRGLYGLLTGGLLGATVSTGIGTPAAHAAPPCSSSAHAGQLSATSNRISQYLAGHPAVNQRLTEIAQEPPDQANLDLRTYLANHPGVASDLRDIRAPLAGQRDQCGLNLPPSNMLMGLGSFVNGWLPFGAGMPFGG